MKSLRLIVLTVSVAALSACQNTPLPEALHKDDVPERFEERAVPGGPIWPASDWWQGFQSPELATLMGLARTQNTDLAAAAARVRQADARARQAGAALLPTLSLNADANHLYGRSGGASLRETDYTVGLGASYELDFWGKNRDAVDSATALARASRADRQTVAITVSTGVANAYFQLLALRERLAVARANLKSSQDMLTLVSRRVQAGFSAPADRIQEQANLAALETALPALEQQELEARNALAILLGRRPEGFAVAATGLDGIMTPAVAPGLPSELIARRPDIAAAEANLVAAHADLAAARAAFFPALTLTANAGLQNPALAAAVDTLTGTGFGYNIAGALVQTIFDNGRIQAKTDEARAREEELLATYRGVVLAALSDVENALGGASHLATQEDAARNQIVQSERLLRAAQKKYSAGSADFLVVVDAERTLYAARDQLAQIRVARLSASIALIRALGGAFSVVQKP
ncbi:MAG TPA: efflux transporter outer membrane subunit [Rhizomicrobium sp.]|jgi:NodT family efflux transporter outer membrane factor (OMF) lipoprotein